MHLALVCLTELPPRKFYEEFKNERPTRDGKFIQIKETEKQPTPAQIEHYTTVKAHRFYQFAMCFYKIWRYQNGGDLLEGVNQQNEEARSPNVTGMGEKLLSQKEKNALDLKMTTEIDWWVYVDNCLTKAIQNYNSITTKRNGHNQPIFIDLIIKLTICRAFANAKTMRFMTA